MEHSIQLQETSTVLSLGSELHLWDPIRLQELRRTHRLLPDELHNVFTQLSLYAQTVFVRALPCVKIAAMNAISVSSTTLTT